MKTLYVLTGLLLSGSSIANAQYNELSVQLGSSLFSFRGSRVVRESFFNIGREPAPPRVGSASYTNDPWSNRSGFSWGVTMQAQHVAKNKFITGLQLAYESLSTKTNIIGGNDMGQFIAFQQGSSTFTYEYINLHPFLGHRFGNRQLSLDLTAGFDAAIRTCLELRKTESGVIFVSTKSTTYDQTVDSTDRLSVGCNFAFFFASTQT